MVPYGLWCGMVVVGVQTIVVTRDPGSQWQQLAIKSHYFIPLPLRLVVVVVVLFLLLPLLPLPDCHSTASFILHRSFQSGYLFLLIHCTHIRTHARVGTTKKEKKASFHARRPKNYLPPSLPPSLTPLEEWLWLWHYRNNEFLALPFLW